MIRCASTGVPSVLSMDCEMCETTDPVTGEKCDNALIRFSVVDCLDGGKVRTFTLLCGFAVNSVLCNCTGLLYITSCWYAVKAACAFRRDML
jgi:hypothetical protein